MCVRVWLFICLFIFIIYFLNVYNYPFFFSDWDYSLEGAALLKKAISSLSNIQYTLLKMIIGHLKRYLAFYLMPAILKPLFFFLDIFLSIFLLLFFFCFEFNFFLFFYFIIFFFLIFFSVCSFLSSSFPSFIIASLFLWLFSFLFFHSFLLCLSSSFIYLYLYLYVFFFPSSFLFFLKDILQASIKRCCKVAGKSG